VHDIRRLAVFCGSSRGADPAYTAGANALGEALARHGIGLVYGGGSVGLMGVLADAVQRAGGEVTGVITEALVGLEVGHNGLGDLRVVATMHERKALMADLADGFVMLAGGFGTLDEFFEALTWSQLGIHDKPCAVLDPDGYFTNLLAFLDRAVTERFVSDTNRSLVLQVTDPDELIERLRSWRRPPGDKWLDDTDR
jgi:uncharacterized protein (TIGR00730 family)